MTKKCAVVLLNWKNIEDTVECIETLSVSDYPALEIIVSDNGYEPAFPRILHKLFPQIQIIENKKNIGFAEGNNVAIRAAFQHQAEFVFILNTDTAIRKDTVRQLIDVFERDPTIGIVGTTTWEYTNPVEDQFPGGYYDPSKTIYKWYSEKNNKYRGLEKYIEVDFVFGSAMCIRKEMAQQAGLFNSDYFCYFEDVEWCYRAKVKGWKIVVALDSHIWHKMGAKEPGESIRSVTGYYYLRNHNYFLKQYGNSVANIQKNYNNFKILINQQLKLMFYRLGISVPNIEYHYAIKQGILDFYNGKNGEQNTWIMKSRKPVVKKEVTVNSKKNQFQVLIPLPDLKEDEFQVITDFISSMAHDFPGVEFLIWIYPTNYMVEDISSNTAPGRIQLKCGWFEPEEWEPGSFVRWANQSAQLDIYGRQTENIKMEIRPKLSRISSSIKKLFPKVTVPGINLQVLVNGKEIDILNLNELKFTPVQFSFPPSDHVHIELKSDKAYNYGLHDSRKISIAVRNLQFQTLNSKNNIYDFNSTMGASGLLSNTCLKFSNELMQIKNARLLEAKEIRNIDKLFSNTDLLLLLSSERTGSRRGKIITSNKFKVPIIATPQTLWNIPFRDGEDLMISTIDNIPKALKKLLHSKEDRDKLTQNMQRTLAHFFE